jgi:hypothetical protein
VPRRLGLTAALAATVCASVAVAAGASPPANGIGSKSPDAIVAAATAAGETARSAHIHGGTSDGRALSLDIRVGKNRGAGRISANGLTFHVIRVGPNAYFKGDVAFWTKAAGPRFAPFAKLFAGKWMKSSATTGDLAPLAGLTNLASLVGQILGDHGKLVNDGPTTFAGHPAVAIRDSTQGGTLYVATTGQPYPLGILKAGNAGGTIYLDGWNAPLSISEPANAIDASSFLIKKK